MFYLDVWSTSKEGRIQVEPYQPVGVIDSSATVERNWRFAVCRTFDFSLSADSVVDAPPTLDSIVRAAVVDL